MRSFTFQLAFFGVVTLTTARPRVHWNPDYQYDAGYEGYKEKGEEYCSVQGSQCTILITLTNDNPFNRVDS